ncbi:MAG: cupin domain-containing protein [Anaerolineales bacterium]|nr:cupin domain-containing protein [Anaerolineales bacterium]
MDNSTDKSVDIGLMVRTFRQKRGLSQKELADLSDISTNTLSLVERGKTSPTVSTLQKIANALNMDISDFFGIESAENKIIFSRTTTRLFLPLDQGYLANLKADFPNSPMKPLNLKLNPGANSGKPVSHKGHEFVYCLKGRLLYIVGSNAFLMEPGDSLYFDAENPHSWQNRGSEPVEALLILCRVDTDQPQLHNDEDFSLQHF